MVRSWEVGKTTLAIFFGESHMRHVTSKLCYFFKYFMDYGILPFFHLAKFQKKKKLIKFEGILIARDNTIERWNDIEHGVYLEYAW